MSVLFAEYKPEVPNLGYMYP